MKKKPSFIYTSVVALLAVVSAPAVWATTAPSKTSDTPTAVPGVPIAQDNASEEEATPSPDSNSVTSYGVIQSDFFAYDSTRPNTPDFEGTKARVGMVIKSATNRVSGQIEVEYNGDSPEVSGFQQQVSLGDYSSQPTEGLVSLRQAQINFDALMVKRGERTFTTRLSAGGVRIGGADYAAPDAAYVPGGYSRQDGVWLQEMMVLSDRFALNVGLGAFNGLYAAANTINLPGGFSGWASTVISKSYWQSVSLNDQHAYVFTSDATLNFENDSALHLVLDYGMQHLAPSTLDYFGSLNSGYASADVYGYTNVRDVEHAEASALYTKADVFGSHGLVAGNGVSAYWEMENAGSSKIAYSEGGTYNLYYTDPGYSDYIYTDLVGVSVAGDTEGKKHLSHLLMADDRLTYAASYSYISLHNGQPYSTATSWIAENTISQVAASAGYGIGTMEAALNVAYAQGSNSRTFTSSTGYGQADSTQAYLAFVYAF